MPLNLDPAIISDTDFLTVYDQRSLTSSFAYSESYIVPASGIVSLREDPKQNSLTVPTGVTATQVPGGSFTEVLTTPGAGQFQVNYVNGTVKFNAADISKTFLIAYSGLGSLIRAKHVNLLSTAFVPFYNKLNGIVPDGGVDFTFPAEVYITGGLHIQGSTIYNEATQVLNFTDDILLLNADEAVGPTSILGIEVNRGALVQGAPENTQLVWTETDTSWNFLSTDDVFPDKTCLLKIRNAGGVRLQKIDSSTTPTETNFVASLVPGDQGTVWFNGVDGQIKAWNGTEVVLLG